MKVLTFSRVFPKGHPKAGQSTYFVEKVWNSFRDGTYSLPDEMHTYVDNYPFKGNDYIQALQRIRTIGSKHHTIRPGNRWKVGDMASLRVWSDKPYQSKQIEFAQVEIKKVWDVRLSIINNSEVHLTINGAQKHSRWVHQLAANDGLESLDFINWFNIHPKKKEQVFAGQIISWNEKITY